MAVTLIRKELNGRMVNCMFKTTLTSMGDGQNPALILRVSIVDDELKPLTSDNAKEILVSEEEFHTELRRNAAVAKQLITSHSTDPEWNPEDYQRNLDDDEEG